MSYYSISVAARELKVQRKTLYEWIARGYIPTPKPGAVAGSRREFWTEAEMKKVRSYRDTRYWGRGSKKQRKKKRKHT